MGAAPTPPATDRDAPGLVGRSLQALYEAWEAVPAETIINLGLEPTEGNLALLALGDAAEALCNAMDLAWAERRRCEAIHPDLRVQCVADPHDSTYEHEAPHPAGSGTVKW